MSGPIVRKYGVPGWDEIFGDKKDQAAKPQGKSKKKTKVKSSIRKEAAGTAKKKAKAKR